MTEWSSIWMTICREKPKYSKRKVPQCNFAYHKSHTACYWIRASGVRSRPLMTWTVARPLVNQRSKEWIPLNCVPHKISLPYSALVSFGIHSRTSRTFPDFRKLRRVWQDPQNPNSVWGVLIVHTPLKGLFRPVLTPHLKREEQRRINSSS